MNVQSVELFCGTKSFSKASKEAGLRTFTTDFNPKFNPDICADALALKAEDFPHNPLVLWASPPCTAFSVAAIGKNWKIDNGIISPKSESATFGLKLFEKTASLIEQIKPEYWFIENPRGMMRKIADTILNKHHLNPYTRHTVTYCQYGDSRMKPTDIWTNHPTWQPRQACKSGDTCHEPAPRGSRTGTQGLKDAETRSIIPHNLC